MESRTPSIIDLSAEVAKLTMLRRTPQSTIADREGSGARLASYRDGGEWQAIPPSSFVTMNSDGTSIRSFAPAAAAQAAGKRTRSCIAATETRSLTSSSHS